MDERQALAQLLEHGSKPPYPGMPQGQPMPGRKGLRDLLSRLLSEPDKIAPPITEVVNRAKALADFLNPAQDILDSSKAVSEAVMAGKPVDAAAAMAMLGLSVHPGTGKVVKAKNMAEVPNLRGVPVEEALAISRADPHLIKRTEPDPAEGLYVGGPRDVKTEADLIANRAASDAHLRENIKGQHWYRRYRDWMNEVTGGDPKANEWMSAQHGQWSAGVSPEAELQFALKENNSALAGTPTRGYMGPEHEAFQKALAANDPSLIPLAEKTGEYYQHINPNLNQYPTATAVNDFRHAWEMGFKTPQGGTVINLTPAQHKFIDYETARMVDRANRDKLGGRDNWTGEEIQASLWVWQKAKALKEQRPKLTMEQALEEANKTIGEFFDKHTFNATYEDLPGSSTGHLERLQMSDDATKAGYSADPRSSHALAPGGRDALYAGVENPNVPGHAMRVRPTVEAQGAWEGDRGLELNQAHVARPLVAFNTNAAGAGNARMATSDRNIVETVEMLRAGLGGQGAGAGHINYLKNKAGDSGSVFVPSERALTPEETLAMRDVGARYGLPDVSDTGRGTTITRFEGGPDAKRTSEAFRAGGSLVDDIQAVFPEGGAPARVHTDSVYQPLSDEWRRGHGSDAVTTKIMAKLDANPAVRDALDNSRYPSMLAQNLLERDTDWARMLGDRGREDLQYLRQLIGQGPGWVGRVREAMGKGLLPAAVGIPFLGAVLSEMEEQASPGGRPQS